MLRRITPEGPVSTIIQMNRLEVWLGAAMAAPYPICTPERDTVLRPSIRASNVVYRLLSVEPNG
jgi:hypothetical protein